MNIPEEAKLTDLIVSILEAWQDGDSTYVAQFSFQALAYEIVEKAIPIIEERVKREIVDALINKGKAMGFLFIEDIAEYGYGQALKQPKEEGE